MNGFYPLSGGVGYGRIRLSMVWRSVQLQAPPEMLGWNIGTVQVDEIKALDLSDDLKAMKIKLQSGLSKASMYSSDSVWTAKHKIKLAVTERYSSSLTIRFRYKSITGSKNAAFAILWLRDVPDEEEREIELPVWKGDFSKAMKSSLDECGDRAGTVKIKLTFWPGLGPKHTDWAVKHNHMRGVIEVLETAHDNLETTKAEKEAGIVDEDNDSSSDSSDDDDEESHMDKEDEKLASEAKPGAEDNEDGKKNGIGHALIAPVKEVVDEAKDYKRHYKSIHRRNRGIMTWKVDDILTPFFVLLTIDRLLEQHNGHSTRQSRRNTRLRVSSSDTVVEYPLRRKCSQPDGFLCLFRFAHLQGLRISSSKTR